MLHYTGSPSEVLGTVQLDDDHYTLQSKNHEDMCDDIEDPGLVKVEEQEQGIVRLHVYKSYWFAVGVCLAPMILISLFLMQGMYVTFDIPKT